MKSLKEVACCVFFLACLSWPIYEFQQALKSLEKRPVRQQEMTQQEMLEAYKASGVEDRFTMRRWTVR